MTEISGFGNLTQMEAATPNSSSASTGKSLLLHWLVRCVKWTLFWGLALPIVWIGLAGERTLDARYMVCGIDPDPVFNEQYWEDGWPLVYLRRHVVNEESAFYRVDQGFLKFAGGRLAADVLILAVILGAAGYVLWAPAKSAALRGFGKFSLRSALAGVTIVCLAAASYGNAWRQSQYELGVGARLEQLGHHVQYGRSGPRWLTRLFSRDSEWVTFRVMKEFELFEEAGDRDLEIALQTGLKDAAHLQELHLGDSWITDDGLARLLAARRSWSIEKLSVDRTPITGQAFAGCRSLDQLEVIWMNESKCTDDGVAAVSRLPGVTFLNVSDCPVTARSIDYALEMPKLRKFVAFDSSIVAADGDELRARGVECLPEDNPEFVDCFSDETYTPDPFAASELFGDDPFASPGD